MQAKPFTFATFPKRAMVRQKGLLSILLPAKIRVDGIVVLNEADLRFDLLSWSELFDNFECSIDGEFWHTCQVEV